MAVTDNDNGLVIFIRRIPSQINEALLVTRLLPYLTREGINYGGFELHKPKGKGFATMHVASKTKGENFLMRMKQFPSTLNLHRFNVEFESHDKQDGGALVRDRKFIEKVEREAHDKIDINQSMKALSIANQASQSVQQRGPQKSFNIEALNCGNWQYDPRGDPVYVSEYCKGGLGKMLVGSRSIAAIFQNPYDPSIWTHRIDFPFEHIDIVYTSQGRRPSLLITFKLGPRMYRNIEHELQKTKNVRKKARVPCLDTEHSKIAGTSFTWELVFEAAQSIHAVQNAIEHIHDGPATSRIRAKAAYNDHPFVDGIRDLNVYLAGLQLPFSINFQALKLALNGHLQPRDVQPLLITVYQALHKHGKSETHCAEALRQLDRDLPWPSPQVPYREISPAATQALLRQILENGLENSSTYRAVARSDTLAMIHHVQITPTGLYLEGPDPEVTNRVLRKYPDQIDCFVRVSFCDEDGDKLQFRFDSSNDEIYEKFQATLDDSIPLCGRTFQFLGFSQSSLRSQTAWFMSPFTTGKVGKTLTTAHAIADLGDFSHLRSPAKCAARIGQAFTDTNGFITVQATDEHELPDVERNGRVFSDGCGIMSKDLAYEVAFRYQRLSMKEKPTVFQIRFRGAKGVLSVDPRMKAGQLCLRPSMIKFETGNDISHDLEICGMADKMRPMNLNRGLIKVLEDLGVPHEGFMQLANETLVRLQHATDSFDKAAKLLEDERVGLSAAIPGLIRRMNQIGIDVRRDRMLCAVVEMAAFVRLRQMKYKGRIFVKDGVKLMGIMDETGYLKEGEIHVAWIDDRGRRATHTGKVAVTRSPTNHPGDVQLAVAVDVPAGSSLKELYNCVIFSQHGDRDLPSQLGGGDLDGDLYDVFWDERILPSRLFMPAEYPRLPPIDLGRTITTQDMSQHFIDFMKNDNIGLLANQLLVISDRMQMGTMDENCITICELMSTALDYPKTGIVADMRKMPKFDKTWKPDFMAPGPKVRIEKLNDPLAVILGAEQETSDDPVSALDPEERKVKFYESPNILGKLYRLVDEKGFYEQLQEQTVDFHRGQSALGEVLDYARRATAGFEFKQHINTAREIRDIYEEQLEDVCIKYALHSAHPLHEIEVVTGAVLGSVFVKKLRDLMSDMKERFGRDVSYVRERIRYGDEDSDDESLPRAVACLYVGVREKGRKMGRHGDVRMWSFAYIAAAMCLEEIERSISGRLPTF